MIPKKIHYCWFGKGELPVKVKEYIASWKRYLPNYEIIQWNEDNFDIEAVQFVREAYKEKKYAFVADYVRFYALYYHGGIYFDSDVEVVKSFDSLLENNFFVGHERPEFLESAIFGSVANHPLLLEILKEYESKSFYLPSGYFDLTICPIIFTKHLSKMFEWQPKNTLEDLGFGVKIFPFDYFCAKEYNTGNIIQTKNTFSIHHFSGSWKPKSQKIFSKIIGATLANYLMRIIWEIKRKLKR